LNIGVSLIMAALAFVSLAALLVGQLSEAAAGPLISLANGLNWLMVHSVDPFARIGIASVRLPHYSGPAGVVYWLYYLPLGMLAVALRSWNPLAPPTPPGTHAVNKQTFIVLAQILLISLVVIHPFSSGLSDGRLRIDFLDVGQGDSALVTMPDGSTLLIDGGGRPAFGSVGTGAIPDSESRFGRDARSIGEAVVSEYLWWRGLDSIDYVLATHADADHIDGLSDVVRNFHVRAALIGRAPARDPEFQIFAGTLAAQKVSFYLIGAGDALRFGAVTAEVLWPPPNESSKAPSGNNDSVALRLELGAHQVLMTGDIEAAAERAILKTGPRLSVEVVKVAHHGSKTSSTSAFVDATRPVLAVVSVGQTSMFGHPSREVVDRWKESGANVLTTGNCGTITITTNGRELQLQTFVQD